MPAAVDHVGVQARLQPGRTALVDLAADRRWSYADLDRSIGAAVAVLVAHAIGPGDRVGTLAKNRAELIILHLACARLGAIYVPFNWRLSAPELAVLIDDCQPALLIADETFASANASAVRIEAIASSIAAARPAHPVPIDRSRPSLILYTSGTTGRCKGVMLSEANLDQTALNFGLHARVTHASVFLNDPPMFHVIGLVTAVRAPLMHGGTVLVSAGFDPALTIARIGDPALGVTHYLAVPQTAAMLRAHVDYDPALFRRLTGIFSGGAPHARAAIEQWLADGIAIADGFGMSEAGTVTCMPLDPALIAAHAGSTGLAMPGVGMRIVDRHDLPCGVGEAGELQLRGANLFPAYWRQPEATAAAFTADGWFRTGDIGLIDDDGFLTIVDRAKDMFISGGENVYPAEIEAALAGHPDIAECAVVGVPDPRWGEVGHLIVVARTGASIDHAQVRDHLIPRLARYKLPAALSLMDGLPRTSSGKIKRAELKSLLAVITG